MATVSVDQWFPDVIPAAQLCPNPIIRREIINSCRDFCQRTMLWTAEIAAPIDVVADQALYPLTYSGAEICDVDRSTFDGKTIKSTSETALDEDSTQEEYLDWRTRTTDIPERFFVTFDKQLRLVYIPDAALTAGLNAWLVLQPLITAITIEDFLCINFKDMIADGAKGRLKAILDMSRTDMQAASIFLSSYEAQMPYAQQKKYKGFQRTTTRSFVRTRYHDF